MQPIDGGIRFDNEEQAGFGVSPEMGYDAAIDYAVHLQQTAISLRGLYFDDVKNINCEIRSEARTACLVATDQIRFAGAVPKICDAEHLVADEAKDTPLE